ncbi:hypothetical protein ECANGB1_1658 [Enterospora canceri]|uniref:Uncharacterized protein n=1 Tax=Enterospora canceri TaxID=1081671 RepID=A0A1Y1S9Y8_9MICR|nr:hypothetical protein ECANGB1_1658 [Enterospora canceri]
MFYSFIGICLTAEANPNTKKVMCVGVSYRRCNQTASPRKRKPVFFEPIEEVAVESDDGNYITMTSPEMAKKTSPIVNNPLYANQEVIDCNRSIDSGFTSEPNTPRNEVSECNLWQYSTLPICQTPHLCNSVERMFSLVQQNTKMLTEHIRMQVFDTRETLNRIIELKEMVSKPIKKKQKRLSKGRVIEKLKGLNILGVCY